MGAIDRLLAEAVERHGVPGVALAVVTPDGIAASGAAGWADLVTRTPMTVAHAANWFSMTKMATATVAVILADRGELDLDAPVARYLPDLWPAAFAPATVGHLLHHSAGLANPLPIRWVHPTGQPRPEPAAMLGRLLARQRRAKAAPGTRAAYSNVGYLALGEVLTAATGVPYEALVRRELLDPLGMDRTGWSWRDLPADVPRATGHQRARPPTRWLLAALLPGGILGLAADGHVALRPFELDGAAYGGLVGPIGDAASLVQLHCSGGQVAGRALVRPEAVEAMARDLTPGRPYAVGLGWCRPQGDDGPWVQHLGGGMGFWNVLRLHPAERVGAVVMSNTTHRWAIAELADEAIAAVAGITS